MESRAYLKPSLTSLGLTDPVLHAIHSYVRMSSETWDTELESTQQFSKFVRPIESGLSVSIEYWKDRVCFVYPKHIFASGTTKIYSYGVDLATQSICARARLRSDMNLRGFLLEEIQLLRSLENGRGIIKSLRASIYFSKSGHAIKEHILQILYDGTFSALVTRQGILSSQEFQTITMDLFTGLARIHAQGKIHGDIHGGNIVFKEEGGKITECALCDFGDTTHSSIEEQTREVNQIFLCLFRLYAMKGQVIPTILKDLCTLADADKNGQIPIDDSEEEFVDFEIYEKGNDIDIEDDQMDEQYLVQDVSAIEVLQVLSRFFAKNA